MISLIIEICLTCKAWKKGWKGWALLPMAIGLGSAFMLGVVIGANGGDPAAAFGIGLLIDVSIIVALAVMVAKAPQTLATKNDDDVREGHVAGVATDSERVAA
jgi:hypothetical protein